MKIKGQTAKKGGGGEPVYKALKQPLSPLEIKTFRSSVSKLGHYLWLDALECKWEYGNSRESHKNAFLQL